MTPRLVRSCVVGLTVLGLLVVAPAPPASAAVTSGFVGDTLTVTLTGAETLTVSCADGSVHVVASTPIADGPACAAVHHLVVNGDNGNQFVILLLMHAGDFSELVDTQVNLSGGDDVLYASSLPVAATMGVGRDIVHTGPASNAHTFNLGGNAEDAFVVDGTSAVEVMQLHGTGTSASVTTNSSQLASATGVSAFAVNGGSGNDVLEATAIPVSSPLVVSLNGGKGDDTVAAGPNGDLLLGGPGNDSVQGGAGPDTLYGGPGADELIGRLGTDTYRTEFGQLTFGGDSVSEDNAVNAFAIDARPGDASVRIRGAAGSGWSIASGLTLPGTQGLPGGISIVQADTTAIAPSTLDDRGQVDTVLAPGLQTITTDATDLVDVTVSSGQWTRVNGPKGAVITSTSQPGEVDVARGVLLIHAPWPDRFNSFVHRVYRDLVFRYVTTPNRTALAARLASHDTTATAVAQNILSGNEYRGVEVDRAYVMILRRASDPTGRAGWISRLARPTSLRSMRAEMYGSSEYFRNFGSDDESTWVRSAYRDILGREVDSDGLAYYSGRLSGGSTRTQVAADLLVSSEARNKVVVRLFNRFAGREPSDGEQRLWAANLTSNVNGEQDVTAWLVAGAGYVTRN